jgi:hypothetical protein
VRTTVPLLDASRRLLAWLRQGSGEPYDESPLFAGDELPDVHADAVERPWRHRWDHLPKRSAGFGFTDRDYATARSRADEVARLTLGEAVWARVERYGFVDLPSRRFPGVSYRLRIGRRIEVRCEPGVQPPWRHPFLCINPTYPLPEAEFFAHLYLYVRDHEDEVIRVAAPQPWDQALGRTF